MDLEEQWKLFMSGNDDELFQCQPKEEEEEEEDSTTIAKIAPECSPLKISTKSKIVYLNSTFYLNDLFWKLKIISYDEEREGIVKKQMKFNFLNAGEVTHFEKMVQHEPDVKMKILNQIDNPSGRVPFKDVRKVDIGLSRNDIMKPKKQSKSAFYNCFVMIFRKLYHGEYREFHVKLFNSGKVEVPGIQSDEMLDCVVRTLIDALQPHCDFSISELKEKRELVLVNSNFNCHYYLNREKLVGRLKTKYKVKCGMDSCNYPGIQCKYKLKNDKEVSYMIFRTGSVLIVGKCDDDELQDIYNFLRTVFKNEYLHICEEESELEKLEKIKKSKKKPTKMKKTITI
jgi:TATA-box binding protein (TBP) (component of TFIID and TFIIIB)